MKDLVKSGKAKTGADITTALRAPKAILASVFHANPSFFREP